MTVVVNKMGPGQLPGDTFHAIEKNTRNFSPQLNVIPNTSSHPSAKQGIKSIKLARKLRGNSTIRLGFSTFPFNQTCRTNASSSYPGRVYVRRPPDFSRQITAGNLKIGDRLVFSSNKSANIETIEAV